MNSYRKSKSNINFPTLTKADSAVLSSAQSDYAPVLLYEGSKFFWRNRLKTDLCIYNHPIFGCFEVIPFNVDSWEELDRLYISHNFIYQVTEAQVKKALDNSRFEPKDHFARQEHVDKVKGLTACDFIIPRLIVESREGIKLVFHSLAGDPAEYYASCTDSVIPKPADLKPAFIKRRRRTK